MRKKIDTYFTMGSFFSKIDILQYSPLSVVLITPCLKILLLLVTDPNHHLKNHHLVRNYNRLYHSQN